MKYINKYHLHLINKSLLNNMEYIVLNIYMI